MMSETAKSMGLFRPSINPTPLYVAEVEDYSKINLTTIGLYQEKQAVRPLQNVSTIGGINNVRVDSAH